MKRLVYATAVTAFVMSQASCDSRTSTSVDIIGGADEPTSQ